MKTTMTVLAEAGRLETALEKLKARQAAQLAATIAKFSPEAVALFQKHQAELAKLKEAKGG